MKERDILRCEGPMGTFFLREDSDKPIVKGYAGTHNILKWGTKLYSVESDCDTNVPFP